MQREVPTCFYCRETGHIRPKCNKLKKDMKSERVVGHKQTIIKRKVKGKTIVIKKL